MKRTLGLLASTALASAAFVSQAGAAPVITLDPVSQNVANGGVASVNVDISGLTQPIGGYSFDLAFNPTLLTGISFTNDPGNTMDLSGSPINDLSNGFGYGISGPLAGSLDVYVAADLSLSQSQLAAAQGTGFVLTTITFGASSVNSGVSPLTVSDFSLSDFLGNDISNTATATGGQICVGGCGGGGGTVAPEMDPAGAVSALTLLAAGIAVLRGRRRILPLAAR